MSELDRLLEADGVLRMARNAKPGDRWPHEPPAPDIGPDGGVREPRRPRGDTDPDQAEQAADAEAADLAE